MSSKVKSGSLMAAIAMAVNGQTWALEPQGIKVGEGHSFVPELQISERWDDNFRAVETDEESSLITSITPSVRLGAQGHKLAYSVGYSLTHDIFHDSRDDDNTDHHLNASLKAELSARHRLSLNAGLDKVEETASLVQELESDKYTDARASVGYGFGAETARGQIELNASTQRLRFDNDLVLSGGAVLNAERERDRHALTSTLYMRVAPKTRLLLEGRVSENEYVSNTELDSRNLAGLVGVTWDVTAKTSGTVKVGVEKKNFDDDALDDKSATAWEIGATWSPLSYSSFTLNTRSALDEGLNGASTIEAKSVALKWKHQWLERLSSTVSASYMLHEYDGAAVPGGDDREDKITDFGLGFTYALQRWMDVGIGYRTGENDSNAPTRSYERNIAALTLNMSL